MWAKQQYYACRENMAYDIFIQHLVENLGGTPQLISTAKILVIISYPATSMVPKNASLFASFTGESEFGF